MGETDYSVGNGDNNIGQVVGICTIFLKQTHSNRNCHKIGWYICTLVPVIFLVLRLWIRAKRFGKWVVAKIFPLDEMLNMMKIASRRLSVNHCLGWYGGGPRNSARYVEQRYAVFMGI
jgi:hypothetical protein